MSSLLGGIGLINKSKTHCINGHDLVSENLDKYCLKNGVRACIICKNERARQNYHKYRSERLAYNRKHREAKTILHREYLQRHPTYIKNWNKNNPDKLKSYEQRYTKSHRAQRLEHCKKFRLENPDYQNQWRQNNPRSSNHFSLELQDAMNNVRVRDNNTCQWYGCYLTHREVTIHVHHIFPRNEYPELELIEQYMICYCAGHHGKWHEARGDAVARLYKPIIQRSR